MKKSIIFTSALAFSLSVSANGLSPLAASLEQYNAVYSPASNTVVVDSYAIPDISDAAAQQGLDIVISESVGSDSLRIKFIKDETALVNKENATVAHCQGGGEWMTSRAAHCQGGGEWMN